ncbi:MAG: hypothetical protein JW753_00765, partial [Dehalococcoidia bacterium]|nr:hypothetical protein [Dehalococcoidia bacterium]
AYQTERADLEPVDLTRMVVRALLELANKPTEPSKPSSLAGVTLDFKTADVTARVNQLAIDEELTESDAPYAHSRRVGRVLRSLRLSQPGRTTGHWQRKWRVTSVDLDRLAASYGVISAEPPPSESDGYDGSNGLMAMDADQPKAAKGISPVTSQVEIGESSEMVKDIIEVA